LFSFSQLQYFSGSAFVDCVCECNFNANFSNNYNIFDVTKKQKVPEEVNDAAGKDSVPCVWEEKL
jgi:hypothetical protein